MHGTCNPPALVTGELCLLTPLESLTLWDETYSQPDLIPVMGRGEHCVGVHIDTGECMLMSPLRLSVSSSLTQLLAAVVRCVNDGENTCQGSTHLLENLVRDRQKECALLDDLLTL